ncbi:hypothetical protein ElyMa_000452600 [Elysia marginata]|uniref:Uncharacterized protein n=1 Tax=Elysia marginata TaxID=1093978 RepID=A0AAV4FPC9_9GAST|nr:hypothetical protein ElyMa_000452600 [Elysia marginata]
MLMCSISLFDNQVVRTLTREGWSTSSNCTRRRRKAKTPGRTTVQFRSFFIREVEKAKRALSPLLVRSAWRLSLCLTETARTSLRFSPVPGDGEDFSEVLTRAGRRRGLL